MVISPDSPKEKTLTDLPESYTDVQPVAVQVKKDCYVPKGCKSVKPWSDLIGEGMKTEYQWLDKVKELIEKPTLLRRSPMHQVPSPAEWGRQQSPEGWSLKWNMLAEASKACSELISCGCKRACRGLCKCTKANLPCTSLSSVCRKLLPRIE